MDGSRVPAMEWPSIANETAGIENMRSIRAAIRYDAKPHRLSTDTDLEQAGLDPRT
jgi:hypothetical protein